MRRVYFYISLLLLVVLTIGTGLGVWGYGEFTKPGPLQNDAVLVIKPGSGVNAIANDLKASSVLSDTLTFRIGGRFVRDQGVLKAGEFLFPAHISVRDALKLLQSGKTVVRRITLAEGLTSFEIVEQLAKAPGLTGTIRDVPQEGSLLPETYHYSFGDPRQTVIDRMTSDMNALVADLWATRNENLPFKTPEQAVVLASIVEKETGVASERAHVAGVFINRLRKGIRLQSDPTVVYGITNGKGPLGRPLKRSELRQKTAFNTYTIKALPPTPIANPGRESLKAVFHPLKTDHLYFVADGTGGHVFAKTLKGHNRNVARWRKIEKKRKNAK